MTIGQKITAIWRIMSIVIVFVILVLDKLFAIKLMVHLNESFLMDVKMVINLN